MRPDEHTQGLVWRNTLPTVCEQDQETLRDPICKAIQAPPAYRPGGNAWLADFKCRPFGSGPG